MVTTLAWETTITAGSVQLQLPIVVGNARIAFVVVIFYNDLIKRFAQTVLFLEPLVLLYGKCLILLFIIRVLTYLIIKNNNKKDLVCCDINYFCCGMFL